jgi:hypothetical protein
MRGKRVDARGVIAIKFRSLGRLEFKTTVESCRSIDKEWPRLL